MNSLKLRIAQFIKHYWFPFTIGVIFGVAVSVGVAFWRLLLGDPRLSNATIAFGTLTLALVTALSIVGNIRQENRRRHDEIVKESRDRKERYLNEIIGWLRELENHIFSTVRLNIIEGMQELKNLTSDLRVTLENAVSLQQLNESIAESNSLQRELRDGEYFREVALRLDSGLCSLIGEVLSNLKQREKIVVNIITSPREIKGIKELEVLIKFIESDSECLDGMSLNEEQLNIVKAARNAMTLKQSIHQAIKKAVELKMSLLKS